MRMTIMSPHCEVSFLTDDVTHQPVAGHIYYSFHELGFAFSDILEGDTPELKEQIWEESKPIPEIVYATQELPGMHKLIDGMYCNADVSGRDAATALYLYWILAYGIKEPIHNEAYLQKAQELYKL